MRLVLDTNVLISALLWHGLPNELLRLIEKKTLTLCISPALLDELNQVLNRPSFSSRIKERKTSPEELVAGIIELAELYPDRKIAPVIKSDPDDDKVLSCALTAGAEYIITGDSHLLKLKKWSDTFILTPRQFVTRFLKL